MPPFLEAILIERKKEMGILSKAAAIIAPTPHKVTQYVDIFDDSGQRVTSLPVSKGASVEDVLSEAKERYPENTAVATELADHRLYSSSGYTYDFETKKPKAPPEPTAEELQAAALAELDSEYQAKFDELDEQIMKAAALKNTELQDSLINDRTALSAEYTEKRGNL